MRVDGDELLAAAAAADAIVLVDREPGDFLVAGTPVALVWPVGSGALDEDDRRPAHRVRPAARS